jgi:hypothetical protein
VKKSLYMTEAKFLDVIGTKVSRVFPPLLTDFTPWFETGL